MLGEDQPVARPGALEDFDSFLCQPEARHDVRHEGEAAGKHFGALPLAVGLVDDAEHRSGVGVIDEFVWQKGVQHDLDRRIGRHRFDQAGALDTNQLVVVNFGELIQLAQRREPHRRQSGNIDHTHVGAGCLDAQYLGVLAEMIAHGLFQGGIAAAVQNQLRIAAEKPRRIDPKRKIAADAGLRALRDDRLGIAVDPPAFHGALSGGLIALSAVAETARPPAGLARPIGVFGLRGLGGRLRHRRSRQRRR